MRNQAFLHPGLPRLWLPEQFFCFYFKQDKGKRNIKRGGLHCAITTLNYEDETVIVNTS